MKDFDIERMMRLNGKQPTMKDHWIAFCGNGRWIRVRGRINERLKGRIKLEKLLAAIFRKDDECSTSKNTNG